MSYLNESNLLSKNQNKTLDPIPENISGIGADGAGPGAASSSMQPNRQWWDIMTSPRKEGYATSSLAGLSTGGLVDGDGVMNAEEGPDGPALDSVEADTSFRSSWKFLTLIGLLSVCAGLGLYFIAKNGNGGGKGKPPWNGGPKTTLAPSSAPSFQPTYASGEMTTLSDTDLQELDNLFLLLSGDSIYSSTSPQGQARLWLHSDNVTVHNAGLIRVTQRYALCVLFFATSGPAGWTKTFLVKGAHECDWKGIGCDKYRVVVRLATADQNLVGALPEEIGFLTSLDTLSMHHNSLTGTLPEGLLRLDSLTYMDLKLNQLTGTLPASMWSLNALTSLDVSGNLFNGTLSSNMWSLSNVTSLLFYNNSLTGPFPEIPGTMAVPPMVYLWVARNHLTGALPESINRLSATMREMAFYDNDFVSTIPSSYSELTQLTYLDLSLNSLSGEIPVLADGITWLFLDGNNLTGPLPALPVSTFGAWLNDNLLSGSVPSDFGVGLANLSELHIYGNKLTGQVPIALCNLASHNVSADCRADAIFFVSCDCCRCY